MFSVPHDEDDPEDGGLKVTASHAIFPRDGGLEAPGCVVGFQFSHEMMYERFMEITSTDNVRLQPFLNFYKKLTQFSFSARDASIPVHQMN